MNKITIALVGKISEAYNSYSKVQDAVNHAASSLNVLVDILWVDSVDVNKTNVEVKLQTANGIILLGGFGENGTEGMIEVARFARENNVPLLGICLGMQIIIIEFARNVLGLKTATSTEFDKNTLYPVVDRIVNQNKITDVEKRMSIGTFSCKLDNNSLAYSVYGKEIIEECFRHGYEFNIKYKEQYLNKGMRLSGTSDDGESIDIVEIPSNNFYLGVQFHPEFKSRPNKPHPLFVKFVESAVKTQK